MHGRLNGTAIQDGMPIAYITRAWTYLRTRQLVWDTITTTILSTIGKGVGFLIPFFIATWFGASAETDAFFYAYGLIVFLALIFSPVVESVIVPFIAEARANNEDVGAFVGKVLGTSLALLVVLSTVFLFLIRPALPVISSFSPAGIDLIFLILLESTPLAVLLVWTSVLSGTLNAYKVFSVPAVSPALRAVVTLAFIYLFKDGIGVHAIAWGYVAGEAARLFTLFAVIRSSKSALFIRLSLGWDRKFVGFLKTSSYQMIGISAFAFVSLINKTMASWLGPGNVTIYEYSEKLYMITVTFMTSGFFPAILSHWSSDYYGSEARKREFNAKVRKTAVAAFFAGVAVFAIFMAAKKQIIWFVYGRGDMPVESLREIELVVAGLLAGLLPYIYGAVFIRGHLVLKNTRIIMWLSVLNCLLSFALNYLLLKAIGLPGIAISTSIISVVISIFLLRSFSTRTQVFS